MENFQAIADEFRQAEACLGIRDASELAGAVDRLLREPETAREMGRRALESAEARRGATGRAVAEIRELQRTHIPRYRPALPWLAIARPLAAAWKWGARHRQAADLCGQRALDAPVISVGNLTMGGTGKTPCVLRLAEALKERGRKPGILTRGYGRKSPVDQLAVGPGETVSTERTGDEPQIFVRSGVAPVGIGADRYRAGLMLRERFGVDVLLLDDGFQHIKLARNVDIVLIDALDPFAGGEVFPLGRLREPLEGLKRADMVLITRSQFSDLAGAIEHEVRRWNQRAPVFRGRVEPKAWVDHRTGAETPACERPFERAGAFCGLGNPLSFRRTLEALGMQPAGWHEFADHHHYRAYEMRRLAHQFQAAGATAVVTTEKDAANLCETCDELVAPLPLYWLKVGMAIEREGEFLEEIERRIGG
jgi:tetraacyldisaccharide 4'-kinase